jgi:hypothetical protein
MWLLEVFPLGLEQARDGLFLLQVRRKCAFGYAWKVSETDAKWYLELCDAD